MRQRRLSIKTNRISCAYTSGLYQVLVTKRMSLSFRVLNNAVTESVTVKVERINIEYNTAPLPYDYNICR